MNKIIVVFGSIFIICLVMKIQVIAQEEYSIIYDLYYQLILYPEQGDHLINNNTSLFHSRFYSCLSVVQQRAQQAAQQHTNRCNNIINIHERAKCEQNNEGAKLYRWINEIRSVCQGNTSWSNTLTGSTAIFTKRQLESLSPGQYEHIVRTTLPQWRYLFVCNKSFRLPKFKGSGQQYTLLLFHRNNIDRSFATQVSASKTKKPTSTFSC